MSFPEIETLWSKIDPYCYSMKLSREKFMSCYADTLRASEKLQKCLPEARLAAARKIAQWGLYPNGEEAVIAPQQNGGVQAYPTAKGLMILAKIAYPDTMFSAHSIHIDDEYEISLGTTQYINHCPDLDTVPTKENLVGTYAIAQQKDSPHCIIEFMGKSEIEAFRAKYGKYQAGPWGDSYQYVRMATLAPLKRLLRRMPQRGEQFEAITSALTNDDRPDPSITPPEQPEIQRSSNAASKIPPSPPAETAEEQTTGKQKRGRGRPKKDETETKTKAQTKTQTEQEPQQKIELQGPRPPAPAPADAVPSIPEDFPI